MWRKRKIGVNQRIYSANIRRDKSMMLEVLDVPLVLLCRLHTIKSPEVLALVCLRIQLPAIDAVLT